MGGRLHDKALWHRRARRQLQREPLCGMCLADGRVVAARIADHVEPHRAAIQSSSGTASCRACARTVTRVARNASSIAATTTRSTPMDGPSTRGIRATPRSQKGQRSLP